jgi:hypothetical protein
MRQNSLPTDTGRLEPRHRRPRLLWVLALAAAACAGPGAELLPTGDGGHDGALPDAGSAAPDASGGCGSLADDAANCGACGFACAPGQSCCDGSCSSDCGLAVTSVEPGYGPLSGGTWLDVRGRGFAGEVRVFVGGSRAPAMAVDETTIVAQAPPGLSGPAEVRVEAGGHEAVRGEAFRYRAYGLFAEAWRTIPMSTPRGYNPTLATLQDGRVLIAGGGDSPQDDDGPATAELFDPATQTMEMAANEMPCTSRSVMMSAVTLLDGRVLIAGGYDNCANLFDPETSSFSSAAAAPRVDLRSGMLIGDGRALFSAGATTEPTAGVVIYDPATNDWEEHLREDVVVSYAARLLDGRVLTTPHGRGATGSFAIFDPDRGSFEEACCIPDDFHVAGLTPTLPDGRMVSLYANSGETRLAISAPGGRSFELLPCVAPAGYVTSLSATAVVGDGTVAILGTVRRARELLSDVYLVDPEAGEVRSFAPLPEATAGLSAITLPSGSIVVAGGQNEEVPTLFSHFYFLEDFGPE